MCASALGVSLWRIAVLSAVPALAADFSNFDTDTRGAADIIKCPTSKVIETAGLPDLWGCIYPGAEVMKVFINAAKNGAGVENVKIMWTTGPAIRCSDRQGDSGSLGSLFRRATRRRGCRRY